MQKHVNLVDLVKSFPTNIYLQNLASIQERTSPLKFAYLAEKSEKGSTSNLSTKPLAVFVDHAAEDHHVHVHEKVSFGSSETPRDHGIINLVYFFYFFYALANVWQTLRGPFSAVSTPMLASKY